MPFGFRRVVLVCLLLLIPPAAGAAGERYVSLAPATTEILFALGLEERVVGVSSYCDYPPAALDKERVGSFSQPNIEKIISLEPDIVFGTGLEQASAGAELRRLGYKVVISDPATFDDLLQSILQIGSLTGTGVQARALTESLQRDVREVSARVSSVPQDKRPRVFIELWHEPLMTAAGGSIVDEALRLAGGVNIASDVQRPYSIFSPEFVISRNPDCVLFTYMDAADPEARMKRRLGWDRIKAVRNNRLINDIDPDIILRPGPRFAEGVRALYLRLYPDGQTPDP